MKKMVVSLALSLVVSMLLVGCIREAQMVGDSAGIYVMTLLGIGGLVALLVADFAYEQSARKAMAKN